MYLLCTDPAQLIVTPDTGSTIDDIDYLDDLSEVWTNYMVFGGGESRDDCSSSSIQLGRGLGLGLGLGLGQG